MSGYAKQRIKVISKTLRILYNMTYKIGCKNIHLTLIMILLFGSTTAIAVIGFAPEVLADTSNDLYVSTQNTGNHVSGLQIVEVVILNDSLLPLHTTPNVTINGNTLVMTETITGNHYGYFASYSNVQAIRDADTDNPNSNPGLNFGNQCNYLNDQAKSTLCDVKDVLKSSKSATVSGSVWPFIQLYDFSDGIIEIQYNKIDGSTETVTLSFDTGNDGAVVMTLDRDAYPAGAEIHTTIFDPRLNIDPTSADTWTWDVTGTAMYYGLNSIEVNQSGFFSNSDVSAKRVDSALVCDGCSIYVDFNTQSTHKDIVEIVSVENRPTNIVQEGNSDYQTERWLSVSESDGGHNTGIFTTTDNNNDSALQVASDANNGASAMISYDDNHTVDILVRHTAPTVIVEPPIEQWTSGLPIQITIVDDSANKNSRLDERLSITDVDSIIPTITTGDPFTLSHSNNTTWVGYAVPLPNEEATRLQNTKIDPTTRDDTKLNLLGNPSDPFSYRATQTHAFLGFKNFAIVEPSTDRLFLIFNDEHEHTIQTSLDAMNLSPNSPFLTGFPILVIDQDFSDLKDFLINDREDDQSGFNMLYYDFSSLGGDDVSVNRFQINVDRKPIALFDISGPSGLVQIPDDFVSAVYDSVITGRLQIVMRVSGMDINAHTPYPVVADLLSFGFKGNSDGNSNTFAATTTNHEIIANQIVRLELEESTDNQGTFTGTVNYVTVNPLTIHDEDIRATLSVASNDATIVIVEDLEEDGNTSISNDPPQLGIDLSNTIDVKSDAHTTSGIDSITTMNLRVTDSSYNVLEMVTSDNHIHLVADLINDQNMDKTFAYHIQIQDSDGTVIAIPRISSFLPGNQSVSPLIPWTPPGPGTYTLTTFVWESFDNPTILSSSISIDVDIT